MCWARCPGCLPPVCAPPRLRKWHRCGSRAVCKLPTRRTSRRALAHRLQTRACVCAAAPRGLLADARHRALAQGSSRSVCCLGTAGGAGACAPTRASCCRPVTQAEKDADPKAEEAANNTHQAHLKEGLAKLTVRAPGQRGHRPAGWYLGAFSCHWLHLEALALAGLPCCSGAGAGPFARPALQAAGAQLLLMAS